MVVVSELATNQGKTASSHRLRPYSVILRVAMLSVICLAACLPELAFARDVVVEKGRIYASSNSADNVPWRGVFLNADVDADYTRYPSGGQKSTLVGFMTRSDKQGSESTVIGYQSAAGAQSTAVGAQTFAYGQSSLAIGGDDLIAGLKGDDPLYQELSLRLSKNVLSPIIEAVNAKYGGNVAEQTGNEWNLENTYLRQNLDSSQPLFASVYSPTIADSRVLSPCTSDNKNVTTSQITPY